MSKDDNQAQDEGRNFEIRALERSDRDWIARFLDEHWGSTRLVSRGKSYYGHLLPGFIAEIEVESGTDGDDDAPALERTGLLLYNIEEDACEILVLHSLSENNGIGTALINTLREALKDSPVKRVWLITTNDNLPALKFWQKHEFVLKALHVDSVQEARRLKPQIPIVGYEGIPVRDEIELEWVK